jgi:YHS domain-containing protein
MTDNSDKQLKIFTMKHLFFFFLLLFSLSSNAQVKHNTNVNQYGVAIDGYDVVAYFKNRASMGKDNIKSSYGGATYFFESQGNKDAFDKNPSTYIPQFGGWCAYAVGKNNSNVEVDPATFKVKDGKLYLFYNRLFNNTLKLWNQDENNLLTKANENWSKSK